MSIFLYNESMSRRQGIFWIGTLSYLGHEMHEFGTHSDVCSWVRGQQEIGEGGYRHYQFIVAFKSKQSLRSAKSILQLPTVHLELSRSSAAGEYVWKEDTRVEGTQFEFGLKPIDRTSKKDWEAIWTSAQKGDMLAIPASVRVGSYRTIRTIMSDYARPAGIIRECFVFWGATGTSKSRRAWDEAGLEAYSKDPRSKFWCGYQGEENIVIDEFRGGIDISHLLRWLDRYPVSVEIKGSSRPLVGYKIWITSNLDPRNWFPEIDEETKAALIRRLNITHFN